MSTIDDRTLGQLIDDRRRETPDHVVLRVEGRDIRCEMLATDVNRVANSLLAAGLAPGHRVATMLRNGYGHVTTLLAITRLGLVWVPLNHNLKGPSLDYVVGHADPDLVIADDRFADALRATTGAAGRRIVTVASDAEIVQVLTTMGGRPASTDAPAVGARSDDVVAISYTSGTTGPPKGVLLTDRMLRTCARGVRATVRARTGDVLFHWEPLHHIAGNQVIFFALMDHVTVAMESHFSASRFWSQVRDSGAQYVHYLGSVLQILLKQPITAAEREHGVKVMWGGGCPREIWDTVRTRFGVELREVWGMTETSSITTVNVGGPVGSVGRALDPFKVAVQALDGSSFAPADVSGQLVVKAVDHGVLTPGYFRDSVGTAALYRDGWLQTGDKARMDEDGHLYFEGRLKDSVRCRGENVSAWEVESVLNSHPVVLQAAVVGVPSEMGEEDIKAFVKVRDSSVFSPAELVAWCADRMAPYQIPRYVEVVPDFETTPTNRIRKEVLSRSTAGCFDRERDRRGARSGVEARPS